MPCTYSSGPPSANDGPIVTSDQLAMKEMSQLIIHFSEEGYFKIRDSLMTGLEENAKAPDWDVFTSPQILDETTNILCSNIIEGCISEEILYNGRNEMSRRLATWWENHQEHDRQRMKKEQEEEAREQLKRNTLSKLTKEEISVLKDSHW